MLHFPLVKITLFAQSKPAFMYLFHISTIILHLLISHNPHHQETIVSLSTQPVSDHSPIPPYRGEGGGRE